MTEQPDVPELPSSTRLIATLSIVAMLSGLLVVLVYEYTKPIIAENQRIATERAIFKILPAAVKRLSFKVENGQLIQVPDNTPDELIYAGYDQNNKLAGLALPAQAQGYQDTVKILYAYDPYRGCITGFAVLKSTETPGFGTQISTNQEFLDNFTCLKAEVSPSLDGLRHPITTVRHGSKQHPWEIDAIAGSTITSNAVGRMLNQSAQKFHPVIAKNLALLEQAGQKSEVLDETH
jgi:electron transport complex protein RnfG